MPKERFHLYLADELLKRCTEVPNAAQTGAGTGPEDATAFSPRLSLSSLQPRSRSSRWFYAGVISPDIFFYDLPSFSLSPLGDALHDLLDREGISVIYDWIAQTSSSGTDAQARTNVDKADTKKGLTEKETVSEAAPEERVSWAIGFACHFLTDAAWHPVINELSKPRLGKEVETADRRATNRFLPFVAGVRRTKGHLASGSSLPAAGYCSSQIECHRLLESELEALWLARSPTPAKYGELLEDLRHRGLLLQIASHYVRFLEFVGLNAEVSSRRITKCFLWQNFLLRLFANKMLGRKRDLLLPLWPTRFLGVLVTPVRPVLPAWFSGALPEDRNPFSDYFMERATTSLESRLCAFVKRLSQFLPG